MMVPTSGPLPSATLTVIRDRTILRTITIPVAAADATGRITQLIPVSIESFDSGAYTLRLSITQNDQRELREVNFEIK
jgi:hypothetical protein